MFVAIKEVHEDGMKHGCRDILNKKLQKMYIYANITVKQMQAQVDCIDMQSNPDGEYKYIMLYQDHLTKWTVLRPLKTNKAEEIAEK